MTISRTQSNKNNLTGSVSSIPLTFGSPISIGGTLALMIGTVVNETSPAPTIADDKGNTGYTLVDSFYDSTDGFYLATFWLKNIINAPQTLTLTFNNGASTFSSFLGTEFAGVDPTAALEGHSISGRLIGSAGTNIIKAPAIVPADNGSLIWGGVVNVVGGGTIVAGSAFTQDLLTASAYCTEYQVQGIAASIQAAFTNSSTTDAFIAASMAFKSAAGGGPTTPPWFPMTSDDQPTFESINIGG